MTRNKHKPSHPEGADAASADAAPASTPAPSAEMPAAPADTPSAEEALRQELAASRENHLRLLADFENFRKRLVRERAEMAQRAGESLLTELLPVIDHFELALAKAEDPGSPFCTGLRMVYEQLLAVLGKAGLQPVDAHAACFDPGQHEAIAYLPSHEVPEGRVVEQTRRGYRLGERVIRPASVVVSAGAPAPAGTTSGEPAATAVPPDAPPVAEP